MDIIIIPFDLLLGSSTIVIDNKHFLDVYREIIHSVFARKPIVYFYG